MEGGRHNADAAREEASRLRSLPRRYALAIGGGYFAIAGVYIWASGALAAREAASVEHLEWLEQVKGTAFVVVTAVLLFFFSRALFRRISKAALALLRHADAARVLERRALAGTIASSIAHDSSNELMVAKLSAAELRGEVGPRGAEPLHDLEESVERLIAMMRRLRDLGSPTRAAAPAELDLVETARRSVTHLRAHPTIRGSDVRFAGDGPIVVRGYPVLVDELVTNLMLNAAEAAGGHGTIAVRVEATKEGPTLTVEDDGPGVPEALREEIFEPFFTTKTDGTGLGLVGARFAANAHGGHLTLGVSALGGARFDVLLPGVSEPARSV